MNIIWCLIFGREARGGCMRAVLLLPSFFLALSVPLLAQASTYQWQDDKGVLHFTDNPDRIPEKYLNRAREIESVKPEPKPASPNKAPDVPAAASPGAAGTKAPSPAAGAVSPDRARVEAELKGLKEGLDTKRKELERLRHKWSVAKGRTPSDEEVKEFEKKRAEGKASFKDNPYVNRKPLSSPGPARAAYYNKLEEVRKDEERVRQLEQQLLAR